MMAPNERLVMKPCIGCKHLSRGGRFCFADDQRKPIYDSMTGATQWRDARYPDLHGFPPFPEDMRKEGGRCGPERKLYEPKLLERLWLALLKLLYRARETDIG